MNNQYKFLTTYFIISVIIINFFPNSAISQQVSAEHLNEIAPHQGSRDDSIKSSASKEILAMAAAVGVNQAFHETIQKINPTLAAITAPILAEQTASHFFSEKSAKKTKKQITDTIGYDPTRSIGEFNQRDWNERRQLSEIGLRNLQDSLIDQELAKYIEKANQRAQRDIEYYKGKGYTFDPKTNRVNLPGGKSIDAKDIFTPKGFKTLGLSPEKLKEFKKQQKKFEQKAIRQGNAKIAKIIQSAKNKAKKIAAKKAQSAKSSPYDDLGSQKFKGAKKDGIFTNGQKSQGIGGHYAASSFNPNWRPPSFQEILNQQKLLQKGGLGSNSEGGELTMLSKRYGTDLIGLSDNNIFDMIHRQYLRKRSQLSDISDFETIE